MRTNNEDAFLALIFDGREVRYLGKTGVGGLGELEYIFAVSDGMGGAKSGEIASKIAVDRIAQLFPQRFARKARDRPGLREDTLLRLFKAIHHDLLVLGASYEECAGMGATLSLAWLAGGRLHFAHVGDSRLYHFPPAGGLHQLTDDHNHVGWLRRTGRITEREARMHPMRHSLHRAMGAGMKDVDPHLGSLPVVPGDRFLLCTDGVIDGLWDRHLEELVRMEPMPPPEPSVAQRLVREAVEKSGRDNATAVVFEALETLPVPPAA